MRREHGQHSPSPRIGGPHSLASVPFAHPEADRVLLPCPRNRPVIGDVTSTALHAALTGLAQRQRVTADNIANLQTPGFLAGRVDFESGLRSALSSGRTPTGSAGTVARSLEPTRTDGNNVNLDAETVIATETGLRYQLALNALDGKYSVLRTALRTA
ncbi:flagellar basal body rod protein FlgB [Geodermatophilus sp. TF02-6]|nr:flagellar basal body rod protein FlgB [Geodermatophilus sp. TF02-6]